MSDISDAVGDGSLRWEKFMSSLGELEERLSATPAEWLGPAGRILREDAGATCELLNLRLGIQVNEFVLIENDQFGRGSGSPGPRQPVLMRSVDPVSD